MNILQVFSWQYFIWLLKIQSRLFYILWQTVTKVFNWITGAA